MKFNIFDIEIEIKFSFVLIIAFSLLIGNYNLVYVLLFSALHELGHIAVLYFLRGKVDSITLAYYGMGMKHSSSLTSKNEILFLLGGIAVNAFFALIGVKRNINFGLFVINAMPVYPLDGGRIAKIMLEEIFDAIVSEKVYFTISMLCVGAFCVASFYYKNISLALISVYLIIYSVKNYS